MKPSHPRVELLAALATCACLLPTAVLAQQHSNPALDRQHEQAVAIAYGGAPGALEQAVLLHGQVVHQRTRNDAQRFDCLKSHANLLYYYGRLDGARLYMEAAAQQAAEEGRDYDAAQTYIDAALLAREAGTLGAMRDLARRAVDLSGSPRVDRGQRAEILARVGR